MTMQTPIADFVRAYREKGAIRLHMPGHKGEPYTGAEENDITEIDGADSLYEADGIIRQSEDNASLLYGSAATYYSAEGSSLSIRAMLYLTALYAAREGRPYRILAGRNAHRAFFTAAALLRADVEFLPMGDTYMSTELSERELHSRFSSPATRPVALYLTTPDYLGSMLDLTWVSALCREFGVLLLVDNAHGAYLRFLSPSRHPLDLGADLVADSAHKTLPVLTGGAYLHVGHSAPPFFCEEGKRALSVFGSTSPSYLILSSLDLCNRYLADGYRERLAECVERVREVKDRLRASGFSVVSDEAMKITILPKAYGYTGRELAAYLHENGIVTEFSDPDHVVLMPSVDTKPEELSFLASVLSSLARRPAITDAPVRLVGGGRRISLSEALLAPSETVPLSDSLGRILSSWGVGCPPAVPIVALGEEITEQAIEAMRYYGIESCRVVCEK